jgi:hypothetical protein
MGGKCFPHKKGSRHTKFLRETNFKMCLSLRINLSPEQLLSGSPWRHPFHVTLLLSAASNGDVKRLINTQFRDNVILLAYSFLGEFAKLRIATINFVMF